MSESDDQTSEDRNAAASGGTADDVTGSDGRNPAASGRAQRSGLPVVLAIGGLILLVDQLTKVWAVEGLDGGRVIDLAGSLRLRLVENSGSAFSLGSGLGPWLGVVAAVVAVVLVVAARRSVDPWQQLSIGLLLGGAVGNLVDRVVRADDGLLSGAVIDFVDLQWWPVFNVADMAITSGVILMVLVMGRRHDVAAPDPR